MSQQINLLDIRWQPRRRYSSLGAGLLAVALVLALCYVVGLGLRAQAAAVAARTEAIEREFAVVKALDTTGQAGSPSRAALELADLRSMESVQRRLRIAVESGRAGSTAGYSNYFLALSRVASQTLWLTRFEIAADGHSIELAGRMTDPSQLAAYLRQLDSEPLFKGREFSQLTVSAVDPSPGGVARSGDTDFDLRSAAATALRAQ